MTSTDGRMLDAKEHDLLNALTEAMREYSAIASRLVNAITSTSRDEYLILRDEVARLGGHARKREPR